MNPQNKYIRAVLFHFKSESGGLVFGTGGIINPAYELNTRTIVERSSRKECTIKGACENPEFRMSILELRQAVSPFRFAGQNLKWVVSHWLGSPTEPRLNLYETFQWENPDLPASEAVKGFKYFEHFWKIDGEMFARVNWAPKTKKGRHKRPEFFQDEIARKLQNSSAIGFDRQIHSAMSNVLKGSWPITLSAMKTGKDSGKAFEYESSMDRDEINRVDCELICNWEKWQYLTSKELAAEIKTLLSEEIQPRTLETRARRLGLETKRTTGPKMLGQ